MSKIEEFKAAKYDLGQANIWSEKIGKKYYGGTSGKGELGGIVSGKASLTVYYQHSDGDKNYHESPNGFNNALVEIIKRHQSTLIKEAIELLSIKSQQAALAATKEHADLMEAAGLEVKQ